MDECSAFLMMNVKDHLKEMDREQCFKHWEPFKCLHDKEIARLRKRHLRLLSSMGI
jgi:hypothetical protein